MGDRPKWVATGGGPLILVPVEVALHWRGTDGIGPSSEVWESWGEDEFSGTDYGRACGVDDYLGVLGCGPGECLVLGDEPIGDAIGVAKATARRWRWLVLSPIVVTLSLVLIWFGIPRRVAFLLSRPAFERLVATAPVSTYEVEPLGQRLGPYSAYRYATDPRGGVYFRTHAGPDGIGPDTKNLQIVR
jgi:hypothetical protein